MADLVLPAAGWGEKEGTFINSERRIGLVKKVARAPGQALADFHIFQLIAEAWGCGEMFARWTSPEAVFQILKELSRGQPCDITGIGDYAMLDDAGGIQWPLPRGRATSSRSSRAPPVRGRPLLPRRRQGALHLRGAARRCPSRPTRAIPFMLLTGRGSSSQWHTQTRTAKSAVLRKLYPREPYVEINPDRRARARHRAATSGSSSRRGAARCAPRAFVTHVVQPGQLFIPMHYATTQPADASRSSIPTRASRPTSTAPSASAAKTTPRPRPRQADSTRP